MQDHPGGDGCRGILPVALLGTILAGAHNHVRDVLRIRHVAWGAYADLGQRVEAGTVGDFDRRELETEMPALCSEPGSSRPVLPLDVVDDCRFRPCEERRDHQADALAAAGGREREHMLWSVMPEVVQSVASARAPTTDIDALLRIK